MPLIEREQKDKLKTERVKIERVERPPRGMEWPDFNSLFTPDTDPFDGLDTTGDPEADGDNLVNLARQEFIENEEARLDAYRTMIDPEFYLVVCFQSREQVDEFLEKSGLESLGVGNKFVDGLRVARHFGVDVQPIALPTKKPKLMARALHGIKILQKGGEA